MTVYCVTTKHPGDDAPRHLRILATGRAFHTLTEALENVRDYGADAAISEWYGETVQNDNIPQIRNLRFGGLSILLERPVLCLPEHAAGCAPEHQPFLDTATRILGTSLPLSCLTPKDCDGDDLPHNPDGEPAWEYIEDDPAEQVYAVTVCAVESEGRILWTCDTSATDDGEDFPAVLLDYTEEIEQAAISLNGDPQDVNDGDEVCVYVPVSDDGEVLTITDDEAEAADQIRERREESRYGYPWAWGWAYHIDSSDARYHADIIQRAGYVMAEQTAMGETFTGIDGGGYDFDSAHRAPLGAYLLAKWGQTVRVKVCSQGGWLKLYEAIPVGPMIR